MPVITVATLMVVQVEESRITIEEEEEAVAVAVVVVDHINLIRARLSLKKKK